MTSIANSPLAFCHLFPLESFCLAVFSLPAYPTGTCFAMLTNPGWACSTCKAWHVVTTGQERVPRCHLQQVSQELKHSSLRLCSKQGHVLGKYSIKLDQTWQGRKHPKASESDVSLSQLSLCLKRGRPVDLAFCAASLAWDVWADAAVQATHKHNTNTIHAQFRFTLSIQSYLHLHAKSSKIWHLWAVSVYPPKCWSYQDVLKLAKSASKRLQLLQ